jgi:hypothetical protein
MPYCARVYSEQGFVKANFAILERWRRESYTYKIERATAGTLRYKLSTLLVYYLCYQ